MNEYYCQSNEENIQKEISKVCAMRLLFSWGRTVDRKRCMQDKKKSKLEEK